MLPVSLSRALTTPFLGLTLSYPTHVPLPGALSIEGVGIYVLLMLDLAGTLILPTLLPLGEILNVCASCISSDYCPPWAKLSYYGKHFTHQSEEYTHGQQIKFLPSRNIFTI